jgi:hypothetical protein
MSTAHAKLGASGSHRWTACPGSVKAEEGIEEKRSAFADEGTAAHELADLVLTKGGDCQSWVGKTLIDNNAVSVDQEMADYVQVYVDYVKSINGSHEYEQRVDFSDWVPEGFGTADALVVQGTTLYVIDLKYGKGVPVSAVENTQGILYALGALADYEVIHDIQRVVIVIAQPRMDSISEWSISKEELLRWGEWLSERAKEALADDAPRVAGEKQCRFCRAKPTCAQLLRVTHEVIATDFDNLAQMANPDTLTTRQLKKALDNKALIVSWFDAVEQHAFELLESGKSFPGYKLVAGRSLRQWADEASAEQALVGLLADEAYERKLLSVAKAEKVLGKSRAGAVAQLIVKPQGKPVIVPQDDKRPPLGAEVGDFDYFEKTT